MSDPSHTYNGMATKALYATSCQRVCMHAAVVECPDADFMCNDPGTLTCIGDLNDCSGRGDCYKGSCYCHTGWGGADCSEIVCSAGQGCADVRP